MAGGIGGSNPSTVENFDPKDCSYHPDGALSIQRCMHSAVLLKGGKVLLIGGLGEAKGALSTALEIYDPATHHSQVVGQLPKSNAHPPSVVLKDGTVLIAALGYGDQFAVRFDPQSRKTVTIGNTNAGPMSESSAVCLASGAVLITGTGSSGNNAFVFNPDSNTLTAVGPMHKDRFGHTSILLPDGRVLIAGGYKTADCETYDPKTGSFSMAGSLPEPMTHTQSASLPDGEVLLVGARDGRSLQSEACLFDPVSNTVKEIQSPKGFFLMSGMLHRTDGSIWLVSDMGAIAKFNPQSHTWD